jgi:hypothetical protein
VVGETPFLVRFSVFAVFGLVGFRGAETYGIVLVLGFEKSLIPVVLSRFPLS